MKLFAGVLFVISVGFSVWAVRLNGGHFSAAMVAAAAQGTFGALAGAVWGKR